MLTASGDSAITMELKYKQLSTLVSRLVKACWITKGRVRRGCVLCVCTCVCVCVWRGGHIHG